MLSPTYVCFCSLPDEQAVDREGQSEDGCDCDGQATDHVGGVAAGFLQHGVDIVGAQLAALRQRARKAGTVLERKCDLSDRSAVGQVASLKPGALVR